MSRSDIKAGIRVIGPPGENRRLLKGQKKWFIISERSGAAVRKELKDAIETASGDRYCPPTSPSGKKTRPPGGRAGFSPP